MSSYLFAIITTIGLIVLGLAILEMFNLLEELFLVVPIICISGAIALTSFVCIQADNISHIKAPLICIEKYLENSINENDNIIEKEIEKILKETLSEQNLKTNISSYTNDISKTRIIKINIFIGKNIYTEYNYECIVDLKNEKIEKM